MPREPQPATLELPVGRAQAEQVRVREAGTSEDAVLLSLLLTLARNWRRRYQMRPRERRQSTCARSRSTDTVHRLCKIIREMQAPGYMSTYLLQLRSVGWPNGFSSAHFDTHQVESTNTALISKTRDARDRKMAQEGSIDGLLCVPINSYVNYSLAYQSPTTPIDVVLYCSASFIRSHGELSRRIKH